MRRYETICIIRPSAGEEKIGAIVDKTSDIIRQFDGTPVKIDHWGLRKLAYLIQKEAQGYYVYIEYAGHPDAVKEIERIYRIDDQVLRYMTVKTQHTYIPDPEPVEEPVSEESTEVEETKKAEAPSSEDSPVAEEVKEEETPSSEDSPVAEEVKEEEAPSSEDPPVAEETKEAEEKEEDA